MEHGGLRKLVQRAGVLGNVRGGDRHLFDNPAQVPDEERGGRAGGLRAAAADALALGAPAGARRGDGWHAHQEHEARARLRGRARRGHGDVRRAAARARARLRERAGAQRRRAARAAAGADRGGGGVGGVGGRGGAARQVQQGHILDAVRGALAQPRLAFRHARATGGRPLHDHVAHVSLLTRRLADSELLRLNEIILLFL